MDRARHIHYRHKGDTNFKHSNLKMFNNKDLFYGEKVYYVSYSNYIYFD